MDFLKRINNYARIKLRSPLVTGVILLTVVSIVFASATFAWVAMNLENDTSGINMSVEWENALASFSFYKYNIAANKAEKFQDISDIELNQYDQVFIDRNKYTPLIIQIQVESNKLVDSGTGTVGIKISRDGVHPTPHYATEVLRFTAITKPQTIAPVGDNYAGFYNAFNAAYYNPVFALNTSGDSFQIDDYIVSSKVFSNTTDVETTLNATYNSTDTRVIDEEQVLDVFLFITYDKSKMASVSGAGEFVFLNDLRTISVEIPQNG